MIIIDYREEKSGIIELFKETDLDYKINKLNYGDYLIDNQIAVERKTAEDFVVSIMDGRLFCQIINLTKNYDYKCLIIEGNPFKTKYAFNRKALEGALIEISIMLGVSVMFTKTIRDTFERLMLIQKNFKTKRDGLVKRSGYKPKAIRRKMLFILQGLPNVGKIRAKKLLEYFGSIKNLANASIEQLKDIDGIDKKIAARIFEILNLKFENNNIIKEKNNENCCV